MKIYKKFIDITEIGGTFDVTITKENANDNRDEIIEYRETFLEAWEVGQIMGGN